MKYRMPDCRNVTQMVCKSLDGELSLSGQIGMWVHLLMCRYCFRFRKQMLTLRNAVRSDEIGSDEMLCLSDNARMRLTQAVIRSSDDPE